MARNFRQEEIDLDIWFDEQKENLTENYLKKIDAIHPKLEVVEDEDEKEKKKKKKVKQKKDFAKLKEGLEQEFLNSMRRIRKDYQKRYDKIKTGEENFKARKKKADVVLNPSKSSFKFLAKLFKSLSNFIKKYSLKFFNAVKTGLFHFFGNISYNIKRYYIFHMRSRLSPFLWPVANVFRIRAVRPAKKKLDNFTAFRKQFVKSLTNFFSKALELIIKYSKAAFDSFMKGLKAVSGFFTNISKKITSFFNQYIKPIIPRPKKEE